jgi:hypothetical protein
MAFMRARFADPSRAREFAARSKRANGWQLALRTAQEERVILRNLWGTGALLHL